MPWPRQKSIGWMNIRQHEKVTTVPYSGAGFPMNPNDDRWYLPCILCHYVATVSGYLSRHELSCRLSWEQSIHTCFSVIIFLDRFSPGLSKVCAWESQLIICFKYKLGIKMSWTKSMEDSVRGYHFCWKSRWEIRGRGSYDGSIPALFTATDSVSFRSGVVSSKKGTTSQGAWCQACCGSTIWCV